MPALGFENLPVSDSLHVPAVKAAIEPRKLASQGTGLWRRAVSPACLWIWFAVCNMFGNSWQQSGKSNYASHLLSWLLSIMLAGLECSMPAF